MRTGNSVENIMFKSIQRLRKLPTGLNSAITTGNRQASGRITSGVNQGNVFSKIPLPGYAMLSIPVLTFGLGTWQVYRQQWKLDLMKDLDKRTSAPAVPLPHDLEDLSDMEYQKVELVGTFLHDKEMYIGLRSLVSDGKHEGGGGLISSGQSGYCVVTPFKLSDSNITVLVNRGWVPRKNINPSTRTRGQIEDKIKLTAVYRLHERRPQFVPQHKANEKIFHYRDVESMARLADTAPLFFDADSVSTAPDGPIGGQTVISVRNDHFSYILTWYSLSIATSYLWYKRFIRKIPLM